MGIDAFPSLDSPAPAGEVRVTGYGGSGEDEDREKFESAFPDLSGEVPQEAVRSHPPLTSSQENSADLSA